jgi:hypothetical protein
MRGTRRGGTRGAGEISPLPPRPRFPHLTSNDDRWGSMIAVLEHELKPPEPGVGPHPADSLPASPGSRWIEADTGTPTSPLKPPDSGR